MLSSDDVAVWTCSQLTMLVECREEMSDSCSWFSAWVECSWSSVQMPAMSWVGIWRGGVTMLSWMLCMSSRRTIMGGWWSPVGCLERVSGALFLTPGMCNILNWYGRVFSLRFLSLALLMWSRDLSPNIFGSGLWSTAMVRFLHPRRKCLALSRASSTASAIGAYLDSAGCVNLLPTRVIFQPCLQQKRSWEGQDQCFLNNQYPLPCFDQSVARYVGLVLYSNVDFVDDG